MRISHQPRQILCGAGHLANPYGGSARGTHRRIVRAIQSGEMGAMAEKPCGRQQPLPHERLATGGQRGAAARRGRLRAVHAGGLRTAPLQHERLPAEPSGGTGYRGIAGALAAT